MKTSTIIALGIVILSFCIGGYFYPQLPESIASHWNAQGQVDGYMPKFWGLFLMPIISACLLLLFLFIPNIDPLKANIQEFRRYYDGFIVLMMLFLLYLYLLTIFWNLGVRFNMTQVLATAFGLLFYYLGILIEHSRRNWFIGIRTPWTMSSDEVWEKTHRIGGKLFKIAGAFALFGVLLPEYAIFIMIVPILLASVYTVVYSYYAYRQIAK